MAILVLRTVKGTPLTNSEVDGNFSNINSEVGVVNSNVGVLSNLTTNQKSNLVAAINELVLESTSGVGITGGTIANVSLSNVSITTGTFSNVTISGSILSNVSIAGSIITNSTWQGNVIGVANTEAKVGNVANTAPIGASISGNTLTILHQNSGVTATTYGNATLVPSFAVNATGHITSVSNVAVTVANSSITGNILGSQIHPTGVTPATYGSTINLPTFTVDSTGRITSASNVAISPGGVVTVAGATGNVLISNTAPISTTVSGNTITLSLFNSGVTAATYGNALFNPVLVVDALGRITSASNVIATVPNSTITGNIVAGQLQPTGATAGTYGNTLTIPSIAVDNQGRISAASNITLANTAPVGITATGSTTTITLLASGVTAATYGNTLTIPSIAVDTFGRITTASNVTLANTAPIITTAAGSTVTLSHGISGVTAATYGNATLIPSFVVNNQGHITSVSNVAITLQPTGVTAATYGNATNIPSIVVDSTGRITSASNISVSAGTTLTDQTTTTTVQYVLMNAASSGSQSTANVSTTKLYFVPSTGTLNATVFNSLSDVAVKENINPVTGATDIISKLIGVEFDWKDNGRRSAGVVAQDIETIMPHLVDTNENTGLKSVNYSGIIAYLIQSIKELNDRIKKYEDK